MSDELREKVARAIYDVLEGPVNNADFGRQTRQWELSLTLADTAIALIWNEAMEEAAKVAVTPCPVVPHPRECERCGNTKLKYQSPGAVAAAIRARKEP